MRTLFLAWQDPKSRQGYPVGRLDSSNQLYSFRYTKGAEQAATAAGFQPLASFPELRTVYVSEQLFPLFTNRVLRQSRPEYGDYLKWLSVPASERDPVVILSRSGGQRVTDTLEVFPCPEETEAGEYHVHFLAHGLRHMPDSSADRALALKTGEQLLAMRDIQNPQDPDAIALRTAETFERDMYLIGYCPRYLRADLIRLLDSGRSPTITVERVNYPPAPLQFRVLCKAVMTWSEGFTPFSTPEYEPIVTPSASAGTISLPLRLKSA
jgi:hypothetical protein